MTKLKCDRDGFLVVKPVEALSTTSAQQPAALPPAAPSFERPPIPAAMPVRVPLSSPGQKPTRVEVSVPQSVGQNLPDRGIARVATGGMGGVITRF